MTTKNHLLLAAAALAAFFSAAGARAQNAPPTEEPAFAQYSVEATARLLTDRRSRGISDSFRKPTGELHVEAAHASGLVGVFELGGVSSHVYPGSKGYNVLAAGGYRWGDPDAWHFGLGLAHEWFPGAKFTAPTGIDIAIDPNTGAPTLVPTGVRDFKFDTSYAVVEFAYGALEARYLNVVSRDFRGLNTGLVCGMLLQLRADPTSGLDCFARGDHGSRGSHLLDVDWHHALDGRTQLLLHGGVQKVNHFHEADGWDWAAGVKHSRWGLDWTLQAVGARMKAREVFTGTDDNGNVKQLDTTGVVFTIAKTF